MLRLAYERFSPEAGGQTGSKQAWPGGNRLWNKRAQGKRAMVISSPALPAATPAAGSVHEMSRPGGPLFPLLRPDVGLERIRAPVSRAILPPSAFPHHRRMVAIAFLC